MTADELKDLLDSYDGLVYEHNIDILEDLLFAIQELEIKVKKHIKQEERYQ